MGNVQQKLAFTVTEAAQLAGVSRPTLYNWMRIPGFPVFRVGRIVRIPAAAFMEWLNLQTRERSVWGDTYGA